MGLLFSPGQCGLGASGQNGVCSWCPGKSRTQRPGSPELGRWERGWKWGASAVGTGFARAQRRLRGHSFGTTPPTPARARACIHTHTLIVTSQCWDLRHRLSPPEIRKSANAGRGGPRPESARGRGGAAFQGSV